MRVFARVPRVEAAAAAAAAEATTVSGKTSEERGDPCCNETTKDKSASKSNNREDEDEEGLLVSGYDVIVCGTGLVQSILASALSRAGKMVLHADGADRYGELDAVLSLDSMEAWVQTQQKRSTDNLQHAAGKEEEKSSGVDLYEEGLLRGMILHSHSNDSAQNGKASPQVGTDVRTPIGPGVVKSISNKDGWTTAVISLQGWTLADGSHPTAHIRFATPADSAALESVMASRGIVSMRNLLIQNIVTQFSRQYQLDWTPGLLYATGPAVEGLVKSSVAEYVEFKSCLGLYLLMEQQEQRRPTKPSSTTAGSSNEKISPLQLSRVPCSKGDVFRTKLLSPGDKRKLMKFLQMAADHATAVASSAPSEIEIPSTKPSADDEGSDKPNAEQSAAATQPEELIHSLNERQLKQGRSLSRPQNKSVSSDLLSDLRQSMNEGMDFDTYLKDRHGLSERLRTIVIHAMALGGASSTATSETITEAKKFYGTAEAMNDLSRHLLSLGRFGGTAFLVPLWGSGELSQAFCRSSAVHGGACMLRRPPKRVLVDKNNKVYGIILGADAAGSDGAGLGGDQAVMKKDKVVKTKRVVVPSGTIQSSSSLKSSTRILRRISVLRGKLVSNPDEPGDEQRYVIIIPPNTPRVDNAHVIHGVSVDESVHVGPDLNRNGADDIGVTVLHLTTTITINSTSDTEVDDSVLERGVQCLIESNISSSSSGSLEELYHVSFSCLSDFPEVFDGADNDDTNVVGMHICRRKGQSITVDGAFEEAKRIFHDICPGQPFLLRSKELDEAIKERLGARLEDDDDDEVMMLETAMSMINQPEEVTEGANPPTTETTIKTGLEESHSKEASSVPNVLSSATTEGN